MEPTGIRDQPDGRSCGEGFWAQQWLAFVRIAGRLSQKKRRAQGGATAAV
jgi:hypothetical protein